MGLVREPQGIDFVVNSRPLTKKEQEALSKFIKEDKLRRLQSKAKNRTRLKTSSSRKKATA